MTLEDVIKHKPDVGYFESYFHITWLDLLVYLVVFALIFATIFLASVVITRDITPKLLIVSALIPFIFLLLATPLVTITSLHEDWKREYVSDYLETIEEQTSNVNDLEIRNIATGSKFSYDRNEVLFSYQGDIAKESDVEVKLDLEPGEEPFVTFVVVPEEIAEWYSNPYENVRVHLPTDYKFD